MTFEQAQAVQSKQHLSGISEERSVITLLSLLELHLLGVRIKGEALGLHLSVPPGVLTLEVEMHEETEAETHGLGGDKETVAREVAGLVLRAISET